MKMNKRVKKLWVEALKSGEYKQGLEALKVDGFFCCLGVLCDLRAKETGNSWRGGAYLEARLDLPREVQSWAGIEIYDPHIGAYNASALNDQYKKNFEQIANLIQRYL